MKASTEEFSLSLTYISFIIGMELYVLVNAVATLVVTLYFFYNRNGVVRVGKCCSYASRYSFNISFIIGMELYVLVNAVATLVVTLGRVSRASGKKNCSIIYKFLNVCPFDYTAFAVSGKVGIP